MAVRSSPLPRFFSSRFCQSVVVWLVFASSGLATAQVLPPPVDTLHKYEAPATGAGHAPWYRGKLLRAVAVPTALIGLGVATIGARGGEGSAVQTQAALHRHFPHFHTRVDDYFICSMLPTPSWELWCWQASTPATTASTPCW